MISSIRRPSVRPSVDPAISFDGFQTVAVSIVTWCIRREEAQRQRQSPHRMP